MDIPSHIILIDKLHEHLEFLNGHVVHHKFKIHHSFDNLYVIIMADERISDLIFYIDHLRICNLENTQYKNFYYDDKENFDYKKITRFIDALTLIALFIQANDALKLLLEDDRTLAIMTAIVDINTTFITKEVFDQFFTNVIYAPSHALHCCYIIEEYFQYNKFIVHRCKDLIDININTFPCLEIGVSLKLA